jgi:N,N-dimethylformamidase
VTITIAHWKSTFAHFVESGLSFSSQWRRNQNALLLASSTDHEKSYWHTIEEAFVMGEHECASGSDKVRADMTFYEHPAGGGAFSVGSIAWTGSLSHNKYRNNVSTITENVLRRFLVNKPLA